MHRGWRFFLLVALVATGLSCGRTTTVGGDDVVGGETDCANGVDDDLDGRLDCLDPDCANAPACMGGDENCGNGVDDDGDLLVDCDDPDCFQHPLCGSRPEICDNLVDDDGDGYVDCDDSDCHTDPRCSQPWFENCVNGIDDDGDLLVDCDDPDCFSHERCQVNPEICDNGVDDDGDTFVDCDDIECFFHPHCQQPGFEICVNTIDDDGDMLVDCDDPDCFAHQACQQPGDEICDNKVDDDGDTYVDCDDIDCLLHPACIGPTDEICVNGIDDDGDLLVDCDDPDCFDHQQCIQPGQEHCTNGVDDDGDHAIDCDDSDCANHPACVAQEHCTNKVDDDGDGKVDCDDPDCFKHPDCKQPGTEICNNGIDDDEDGDVDCDDSDCSALPICQPGSEICNNNVDDDGDQAVDCDDPDCASFPGCVTALCQPTLDFGTLAAQGSSVTRTAITTGKSDIYTSPCAIPGGGEVVAHFRLSGQADVKLSYEQSGDHVFGLFRAGISEPCNANPRGCYDPESATSGDFSLKGLEEGDYYIITEAFAEGLEGSVQITLSTGSTGPEICTNGVDDDDDGAIDCTDLDCAFDPHCLTQQCKWDFNIGALVINGPSKEVTLNTSGDGNEIEESCAAGGGGDKVIRLAMPVAGGLSVLVQQEGWHVFGLHRNKGPGTTCTADEGSCLDSNQYPGFLVAYDTVEKGVYYYVVDALDPSREGQVSLTFRAYKNRGPELCENEIDDDGDGLIDCMDPDCIGYPGCPGPVCNPEHETGPLVPGGPGKTFQIDTQGADDDQSVPCALGGGKDVVVEVELTEVSGLMINCNQSGDHVLGLFVSGQPRDPCDASPINCADPQTGPIGCDFIFPNLQPGKYYIIVEAFKPGDEGSMTLSLSAVPDHAQEICNNGIDDDGDGLVDCKDSNCAQKPICQGQTCDPAEELDVIVKNGPVKNVAVTTTGAGDSSATSCASGGGEDVAVSFKLAQEANLHVDFAQFGNHVFAIYENKGSGFSCDAAPVDCVPSNGQPTGKALFSGLPAGEYYLVVEAASGGSEGSVVMQMAAK